MFEPAAFLLEPRFPGERGALSLGVALVGGRKERLSLRSLTCEMLQSLMLLLHVIAT